MDGSTGVLEDLPDDGAVVLFDGVCNFCSWSVRFIHEHDDGSLRFAPLRSETGRELLAAHDLPTDYFDSLVYLGDGEAHRKSDGAVRIARHLDRPWRWLRVLEHVPRPVRDVGYDLVGRVRYRLFGKREACMVPDAELRARFVGESTPTPGGDTTD
ncbi:MAG: thiol-disulfide oxidoreductase DCC family protein [Haloarculaceae archaeon]